MGFRAKNSKGVDKNGAKCNMGFGRITKIYQVFFGQPPLNSLDRAIANNTFTTSSPEVGLQMFASREFANCLATRSHLFCSLSPVHHRVDQTLPVTSTLGTADTRENFHQSKHSTIYIKEEVLSNVFSSKLKPSHTIDSNYVLSSS